MPQETFEIRVRIAPSPTGFLHIGLARTALFNYLFAKKYQGDFILRIEDTDTERSSSEFEKDILENLKWLGIEWNEGPDTRAHERGISRAKCTKGEGEALASSTARALAKGESEALASSTARALAKGEGEALASSTIGGDYGPYRQSERTGIYTKYLKKLLNENKAYYCFCPEEDLEVQRQYQMSIGEFPHYSGKCANLTKETIKNYLSQKKPWVIRFRVDSKKISFNDLIRGHLEFNTELMGDIVIAKNLWAPLYNFAVVIDDFEMKISHILRGEEHISNTPKQILIQEALGFPQPKYAHLPLILAPDRTKLSKRHGGATSILEYKKAGYLPEALINFMAFLGWNPGTEREIYSMASLFKEFSLERVQKGGATFNAKRLDHLNGFYIRQKSIEKLTTLCIPYLIKSGLIIEIEIEKPKFKGDECFAFIATPRCACVIKETGDKISIKTLEKIILTYQERLKKLSEISELTDFFFKDKLKYDKSLLKWKEMSDQDVKNILLTLEKLLAKIKEENFNKENLEKILMIEAEKAESRGALLWPLRVALSGKQASASPFEIAEILGKEKTIKRLKEAWDQAL